MKRIVFLIIASLLVLGLVLPGCSEETGFENWIDIAVAGPLSFIQGRDHLAGAEMAMDEINDDGGVNVGGTPYGIRLVEVETNEILDTSGVTGETALTAVIDSVDFVVGGFRTEAVDHYRDVAMDEGVIFFDCGAASNELQESVLLDYDTYKYWFKATPYNGTFLFLNMLKQVGSIASTIKAATNRTTVTAACIVENAEWTGGFKYKLAPYLVASLGLCVTASVQYPDSDATDLSAELTAIKSECGGVDPMITVTVLSGPPGKAYGMQQPTYLPNTFTAGINVEAQDIDYHHDTGSQYHCEMDTWTEDVALTDTTVEWFDNYVAETGRYPCYCAATYDVLYTLKAAIEDEGLNTADIILWLEDLENAQTGTASKTGYYPMPALGPYAGEGPSSENPTGFTDTWYALSAAQAFDIYGDGLIVYYGAAYGVADYDEMAGNWTTGLRLMTGFGSSAHLTSYLDNTGPCLPHDTIYGPGWQTGQGAQWQPIDPDHPELDWHKIGWWPSFAVPYPGWDAPAASLNSTVAGTLFAYGLLDKYGNWNFAYPGRVPLVIPTAYIAYWAV